MHARTHAHYDNTISSGLAIRTCN